jgi:hypothetical protein
LAEQLRQLDGGSPDVDGLRKEAETGLERERLATLQALRAAVEAGTHAVELGRLDEADGHAARAAALAEQLGADAAAAPAAALKASLDRARRAASQVANADAQFAAGRRREAIEALEAFRLKEPDATGISEAIARLVSESNRLAELERRRAQTAAHLAAAEQAWAAENAVAAREEASRALALEPALDRARELVILARVHVRRTADHQTRLSKSRQTLLDARASLDEGHFSHCVAQAEAALVMEETAAEAAELLDEAVRREIEHRVENRRQRAARDDGRAVERHLGEALAALQSGDWDHAANACEAVLAAQASNAEARAIFDQALRRVPVASGAAGGSTAQTGQREATGKTDTPKDRHRISGTR